MGAAHGTYTKGSGVEPEPLFVGTMFDRAYSFSATLSNSR
jgi:hypothetical protein